MFCSFFETMCYYLFILHVLQLYKVKGISLVSRVLSLVRVIKTKACLSLYFGAT